MMMLVLWSVIAAALYVCAVRLHWFSMLPFLHCEGFGCMGTGIVIVCIGGILIPLVIAIIACVIASQHRFTYAIKALAVSLAVMWMTIGGLAQYSRSEDKKNLNASNLDSLKEQSLPASQLEQQRPLLDAKRPITIVNQLKQQTMAFDFKPYIVRAYAREDALLQDSTLEATVMALVPNSTERRVIAKFALRKTSLHSEDGRVVVEGQAVITNTMGARDAYLTVAGKDAVNDVINIQLLPDVK
jgi:hypothetical protein